MGRQGQIRRQSELAAMCMELLTKSGTHMVRYGGISRGTGSSRGLQSELAAIGVLRCPVLREIRGKEQALNIMTGLKAPT
eukprot:jgi/Botrbrau1/19940/Bobra.0059s0057.1